MDKRVLGKRIRELREEVGLTQVELAKKAKVSRSMLSMIEEGNQNSSIDTLDRIAKALGKELKFNIQ